MRTSALVAAVAVLAAGWPAAAAVESDQLELGVAAEVTLVGLTYGVRPELLYRWGPPESASRLRVAAGVLAGPEQLFVPVDVGYRALYRAGSIVRPLFGAGMELQQRFVSDAPPVRQIGLYLEGGSGFALTPQWSLGAVAALDVMFLGGPGAGLGLRAYVAYRF